MELKYDKVTEMKNGSAGASYNQINWGATISNDFSKSGKKFSAAGDAAVADGVNRIEIAKQKYQSIHNVILKLKSIKGVNSIFEEKIIKIDNFLTTYKKAITSMGIIKIGLFIYVGVFIMVLIGSGDLGAAGAGALFGGSGLLGFIVAPIYFLIKPGKVEKEVEALNQELMPYLELHNKIEYIKDNYKTLIDDVSLSDEEKLNIRDEYIKLSIEEALPNTHKTNKFNEKNIYSKEIGKITKYDTTTQKGSISIDDKKYISFSIDMWEDPEKIPEVGMEDINIYNDNGRTRIMTKSYQLENIEKKLK